MQKFKPVVLVVDDEPTIRKLIEVALELAGIEVILAKCGLDAIDKYQTHFRRINLIITDCDCSAGNGVDGPMFINTIQGYRFETPPIIFITGGSMRHTEQYLFELSGNSVIRKPFRLHELLDTVKVNLKLKPIAKPVPLSVEP